MNPSVRIIRIKQYEENNDDKCRGCILDNGIDCSRTAEVFRNIGLGECVDDDNDGLLADYIYIARGE